MILITSWFTVFYNLPTFFEITTVTNPETNSTSIAPTSLRKNHIYFTLHKVYGKLFIDLFSYVVIIALNTLIFIKIAHSTKLSRIPKPGESDITIRRNSCIISCDMDERKYSTISTGSKVLLGVPGNNPDSTTSKKAFKDLGIKTAVNECTRCLYSLNIIIDNKPIFFQWSKQIFRPRPRERTTARKTIVWNISTLHFLPVI